MKTILLDVGDDELTTEDHQQIQQCLDQIAQGDYSEFVEWETVAKGFE